MPKTKVTPRAKHPDRTQQFLNTMQNALETFEDEISSLMEETRGKAYRNYVTAYRESLAPVWNLAPFASIDTLMKTVADKDMKEITTMAECLKPASPHPEVLKEKTAVPDLKTITNTLLQKFTGQSLPDSSICEKIGDVFSQLSMAHKAYSEAAQGIAKLSTLLTPQQYTLLLTATMTPAIQLIVLGQLMSPLSTPPPPQPASSSAVGRMEIVNFTKMRVLLDPGSDAAMTTRLRECLWQPYIANWKDIILTKPIPKQTSQNFFTAMHHNYQKLSQAWITSQAPTIIRRK